MDTGSAIATQFRDKIAIPPSYNSLVGAVAGTGTTFNAKILINDKRHSILLESSYKAVL
jgi:hypothetical protein